MVIDDNITLKNVDLYILGKDNQQKPKAEPVAEVKQKSLPDDKVTVSQKALEASRIKNAVDKVPDVRDAKVAELKDAVSSGTYNVHGEKVADKMVKESMIDTIV